MAHRSVQDNVSTVIPDDLEEIKKFKIEDLNGFLSSDKQMLTDLHKNHIDVGKTGEKN